MDPSDIDKMKKSGDITGLNNALKDPEWRMRQLAAHALGQLARTGVHDKSSIHHLNLALQDSNDGIRQLVASALGHLAKVGVYDRSSLRSLNTALQDPIEGVRKRVASTLAIMDQKIDEQKQDHQSAMGGSEKILSSTIELTVPEFIDTGTFSEIIINLNNTTDKELNDIIVDLSDMEEDFSIIGEVKRNSLKPGMKLQYVIKIKPKMEAGTIPIKIKISGSGAMIDKDYIIKVGGTEIY